MTRDVIPGAWYGDHLATGEHVATIPGQRMVTHLGPMPLPPGETFGIGYPRCTNVGGFRFAGQAHGTLDPARWEWTPDLGWHAFPPPCVGVSPVIYGRSGRLYSSNGSVGSQGYRYIGADGEPVSGD